MKMLDYKTLESLMHSENPEVPKVAKDFDHSKLESFTHIASDGKTLSALAKYTEEAVRDGISILDLSSLEQISSAVLMVFLRCDGIDHILLESLKTLDLACARMLVTAVRKGTSFISIGLGFELSNLAPEVVAELFTAPRYGWFIDGGFHLFDEEYFKECESDGHLV